MFCQEVLSNRHNLGHEILRVLKEFQPGKCMVSQLDKGKIQNLPVKLNLVLV